MDWCGHRVGTKIYTLVQGKSMVERMVKVKVLNRIKIQVVNCSVQFLFSVGFKSKFRVDQFEEKISEDLFVQIYF